MTPKKILVIEDDDDLLEILNIVFQGAGYEVVLSRVILDADYISVLHPDLVLLDVRIAGSKKSGAQICKELKSTDATESLPVILLSAEPNLPMIAMECKADEYISKPFEINNLLFHVKKFLS